MDPMNQSHLPAFDPGETSTVSARWKKWKRSFQIFLDVNNVNIPARKKSYLLHFVGQQVQDVYFGLQGDEEPVVPQGSDVYEEAVKLLDNYFLPMKCLPLERHKFRNLEQASDEPIEKFVLRLREQGNLCEYGDHLEEEIKEQLFERGNSDDLRAKILSKPQMTLAETVEVGRSLETIGKHRQSLKLNAMPVEVNKLNKISSKVKANVKNECYRCGRVGHFANDESCPAKDRKCERCGLVGHFKKRCNTNPQKQKGRGDKRLRQVMTDMRVADSDDSDDTGNNSEDSDEEVQYLFATDPDKGEKVVCEVGGVKIEWVVDSGAGVNVITRQAWDFLKKQKVRVTYQSTSVKKPLKAYGGHPIEVAGMFSTTVATKNNITEAEIFVVEKGSCCLLGRKTAKALGILSINTSVWSVKRDEGERIGKIIGAVAEIQINPTVRPVQQTQCHIPIPLREKTEREIRRLLDQDVIEEAPRDSPWISRLVVRPKPGDTSEVRLCVDMRDANKAIIPQHYPLPTFDSIIPHLNNCKWFSKIDLNKAFHQVELAEGSRAITTFAAHNGYYRYKRLMFGMNCASEVFQCIMERILTGLPGVKPFIDDVLVFAATKKEHDIILKAVLDRLESCGATINRQKCEFGKNEVEFMGHRLSGNGISPTDDKVETIKRFRDPQTVEELRSFLGLVNYLGKFIPDLATLTTPLRRLLKKNIPFSWGKEQQHAFSKIKDILSNPKNLGYYSPLDKTIVIADASPTGLGAVLIQESDGRKRVICYISKGLSETEQAYAQNEKEALALVWSVERLEMYLRGLEFLLVTDHQPLKVLFGPKQRPCRRIERWALRLQSFRFKIIHIPGKANIADPLSRLPKFLDCATYDEHGESMLLAIVEVTKPAAMTLEEVTKATLKDSELATVKAAIVSGQWTESVKKYIPFKDELLVVNDVLLRGDRLVIPQTIRKRILELSHIGHPGIERTKQRLRAKVWWPTIDREAENLVRSCMDCQIVSQPGSPEPLKVRELPAVPWSYLSMDILGPLPSGESLLVVIDLYSRYRIVEVLRQTATADILKKLRPIFLRLGFPDVLLADNAANFSSDEMKEFCVQYGIQLRHTTPYWPQANGEVERQNRSILKILRIAAHNKSDWKKDLDVFNYVYSLTPHPATGRSPAELAFGRQFKDWIPQISAKHSVQDETVRDRDHAYRAAAKERYDKAHNTRESTLAEGDVVLMKNLVKQNKLSPTFLPAPARVIKKEGNSILVETPEGVQYRRNTSHVKKVPNNSIVASNGRDMENEEDLEEETEADWATPRNIQTSPLQASNGQSAMGRPTRHVRRPLRYDDYVMDLGA